MDQRISDMESTLLERQEVAQHAAASSCWVIIHDTVFDVTEFISEHPGGRNVILRAAGKDATEAFDAVHSKDLLEKYKAQIPTMGYVAESSQSAQASDSSEGEVKARRTSHRRHLRQVINIDDFEAAAADILPPKYMAFFRSGADSEVACRWNKKSWAAIRLRPRVLVPNSEIDISTSLLGNRFSAPFFIAPAGGGKFANRQGEVLWTQAAGRHGILQWSCSNAGSTCKEMSDARIHGQALYWQIYAFKDLEATRKQVEQAVAAGYRGFALTVDAVHVGKRERDMRFTIAETLSEISDDDDDTPVNSVSVSRPPVYDSFEFSSAIQWLRSITDLPIAIKGVQSWEDAQLCMHHGAHPWLSNHGGRQLDAAPSAAETLLEIREHCPEVLERCDVIVDGGITRGTEIVKALALGAKGVSIGRGFLFALAFGSDGLDKAIRILKQEVEATMGLLGVSSVAELRPCHVEARGLSIAGAVTRALL